MVMNTMTTVESMVTDGCYILALCLMMLNDSGRIMFDIKADHFLSS